MRKNTIFFIFLIFIFCFPKFCFSITSEEERFYVAEKAFTDSFYDVSISLFERFIKDYPQSSYFIKAKLYIAKSYYFKENYPKALEVFNEVLAKLPSNSNLVDEIYYWIAEIYAKGKNFKDSNVYAQKIIDNFPNSKFKWWTLYRIGENNLELSNLDKAEEVFRQIIFESPDVEVIEDTYPKLLGLYFQKGNYQQTINLAERYLKEFKDPKQKFYAHFYLAESLYALNNFDKAIENYLVALSLTDQQYFKDLIFKGLGFSYFGKSNEAEAKKYIFNIQNEELRYFSEGIYNLKRKDYLAALEAFNIFLQKFPQSGLAPNIYLNRADTLYELGRINDAISDYKYILDNFKGKQYLDIIDKTHYGLAWCYLKNSEFKKAIEEFKNTLKYTDNPVVKLSSQIQIADTYQEAGDYNKALEIYNDILKTNPSTVYADYIQFQIAMTFLKTKRLQEALIALKNLQKSYPNSKLIPEVYYYLAVSYFSMEQYQEAEALLEDFMAKFKESDYYPKAYYLYGKCFYNKKEYQKALEIFSDIIKKFNNKELNELVYIDMANAYLNLSLPNEAKKIWETFLSKFPTSNYAGYVSLYLGGLYEKEQNYQEAEFYYRKVLDEYKDTTWAKEALLSLAHLYWIKGELKLAEEYLDRAIKLDEPISTKAKLYLAKIYTQKKEYKNALKLYDELIGLKGQISKAATIEKAFLLKDMQEYNSAINLLKKIIEEGVDSSDIRLTLGFCLEKTKKYDEALEQYFKVVYLFNNNEDEKIKAYFRIASIYERQEKINEAKEIYNKIINSGRDEAKIAQMRLKNLENKK